jgi:hypothetical protein
MNPTPRDLYVDQLLTNMGIGYNNPIYIVDGICPLVQVNKDSGIIPALTQSPHFRDSASLRAPGTPSKGHGFGTDLTATYTCRRYSFRAEIDDDTRRNAGAPFQVDQLLAKFAIDKIQMKREVNWAGSNFKTGVWSQDLTGGTHFTRWNDIGGSNPQQDLDDYSGEIEARVGMTPNTLVLGRNAWHKGLKFNPVLIDLIKNTERAKITIERAAELLEIDRIIVGKAIYTTTAAGTAEASVSYSRIWTTGDALLMYVAPSPSLFVPSACYTFWVPREGAPANAPQYIKRMRNEESEIDIFESNSYFDQKVTVSRAATFFSGATN